MPSPPSPPATTYLFLLTHTPPYPFFPSACATHCALPPPLLQNAAAYLLDAHAFAATRTLCSFHCHVRAGNCAPFRGAAIPCAAPTPASTTPAARLHRSQLALLSSAFHFFLVPVLNAPFGAPYPAFAFAFLGQVSCALIFTRCALCASSVRRNDLRCLAPHTYLTAPCPADISGVGPVCRALYRGDVLCLRLTVATPPHTAGVPFAHLRVVWCRVWCAGLPATSCRSLACIPLPWLPRDVRGTRGSGCAFRVRAVHGSCLCHCLPACCTFFTPGSRRPL